MPFCPICGYEYQPGAPACPDCGVRLDSRPPARLAAQHEEPVVAVAEVPNEALAGMWVELLANSGIPCLAKAMGPGVGAWASAALFPHRLLVRACDEQRAIDLLRSYAGDDPSVSIMPPDDPD